MPTWKIDFSLPIDLTNPEIVNLLAEAKAMARVICGIPITPPQRDKINKLNILRAIRGTTALEGNPLSEDAVAKLISSKAKASTKDEQEIINAREAQNYITGILTKDRDQPLSDHLVREIHKLVSQGIDYDKNDPGVYRRHAVTAGEYIPPRTGDEVRADMRRFFEWLNAGPGRVLDPLIRAVAAHFFLISIHPFGDGNGRTARAVESYILYQERLNTLGFYSLANYYYRNRARYIEALDEVRFQAHQLTPFVLFCLRGFVEELRIVHEEVVKESVRIAYRDYAREVLLHGGLLHSKTGERRLKLVLSLVNLPAGIPLTELFSGIHPPDSLYARKTTKTVRRDVNFLIEKDLVRIEAEKLFANLELMHQFSAVAPVPEKAG